MEAGKAGAKDIQKHGILLKDSLRSGSGGARSRWARQGGYTSARSDNTAEPITAHNLAGKGSGSCKGPS